MSPYCTGCLYCRMLSYGDFTRACHYYLDTGKKPQYSDNGCASRKIVSEAERIEYIGGLRSTNYTVMPPKRRTEDDYIFDSRGALDGWDWEME